MKKVKKISINKGSPILKAIWSLGFFYLSILYLLLLTAYYFVSCDSNLINYYFNSDCLQIPSMYKDLFITQNPLTGWGISNAPSLFPDTLLNFLFFFLTGNFIKSMLIPSFIQPILIIILFRGIIKEVYPKLSESYFVLSVLLFSLFFVIRGVSGYWQYAFLLVSINFHMGTFTFTLLAVLLSFKGIKSKNGFFMFLLTLLVTAGIISDRIFLVLFVIPFGLSCLFFLFFNGIKNYLGKKALLMIFVLGIGTLIGYILQNQISKSGIVEFPPSTLTKFDFAAKKCLEVFTSNGFRDIGYLIIKFLCGKSLGGYIQTLILALMLGSFVMNCQLLWKAIQLARIKRNNVSVSLLFNIFTLIFFIVVLIAPISRWHDALPEEWIRYNISAYLFAVLNFGVYCMLFVKEHNKNIVSAGFNLLLVVSITTITFKLVKSSALEKFNSIISYYPVQAVQADSIALVNNLKYGVGDYGQAKFITMFSRTGLRVYAVYQDVSPYYVLANKNWFYRSVEDRNKRPQFDFIVTYGFPDPARAKRVLNDHFKMIQSKEMEIIIGQKFEYDPYTGNLSLVADNNHLLN